jgi:hypothetical protein
LYRRSRLVARLNALGVAPLADPCDVILDGDCDQEVVAAVRRLNSLDREIVMLYDWEDPVPQRHCRDDGHDQGCNRPEVNRAYRRLARMLQITETPPADVHPRRYRRQLSDESIRLWERRTGEYGAYVKAAESK